MTIDESTKERLQWLLYNGARLGWENEASPYQELYKALLRVLKTNHLGSDKGVLLMWTSSRVSEGYAHQLEPFGNDSDSQFSSWETVGEIHAALQRR